MVDSNGVIVPSASDLSRAIIFLIEGISNDERVNARFRANPGGYFNTIGLPTDGIPEVMGELGLGQEASFFSICSFTCLSTSGCTLTCWNTNTTAATVKLSATAAQKG